ncbi:MAG: isoprenylcysteine carboxylmethyltransferase family protein [Chloroherpetonaceae bacterium]|nr:isoprenylcysteine carboxylmethyltransferase family protein [Chloroherpetonaceae bacterium]
MKTTIRFFNAFIRIFFLLLLLIFLPAWFVGIEQQIEIRISVAIYALFIFNSLWPAVQGRFSKKKDDILPPTRLEAWLDNAVIFGFWGIHFSAIFDYKLALSTSLFSFFPSTVSIFFPREFSFYLGLIVMILSLVLAYSSVGTLGEYFDRLTIKKNQPLITSGVYGVVRHPIYSAYLLLFSGFCLIMKSPLSLVLLLLIAYLWSITFIKREELMLIKQFGDSYIEYSKKVKRLIPFIY